MSAIQETNFVCDVDACVLFIDFVYSAYGDRLVKVVSLLMRRTLGARVDLVHVNVRWVLIVADIAVKSVTVRVIVVYAPNDQSERCLFFHKLGPFLMNPARLVLIGNWNVTWTQR